MVPNPVITAAIVIRAVIRLAATVVQDVLKTHLPGQNSLAPDRCSRIILSSAAFRQGCPGPPRARSLPAACPSRTSPTVRNGCESELWPDSYSVAANFGVGMLLGRQLGVVKTPIADGTNAVGLESCRT